MQGELEMTFMNQVCRAANFRALLRHDEIQEALEEVVDIYDKLYSEDNRGTRIVDTLRLAGDVAGPHIFDAEQAPIKVLRLDKKIKIPGAPFQSLLALLNNDARQDESIQPFLKEELEYCYYADSEIKMKGSSQQFLSRNAFLGSEVLMDGVRFTSFHKTKNCYVIIHRDNGSVHAARIADIIIHKRRTTHEDKIEEPFILVEQLEDLAQPDVDNDLYRRYEHGGGFLCYDHYLPPEFIRPEDIVCHFARTPMIFPGITKPCIHVLPLDMVSLCSPLWFYKV